MSTGSLERQARVARAAQDAEPALSEADADSQGYTLSVVDIRTRTTLGHAKTMELLGDGAIPGVRVSNRGQWQWRVRPDALDAAILEHCDPTLLPTDLIPLIEAVAEVNGKRVKNRSATYKRVAAWLAARVRDEDLTIYRVFGVARYSRFEVAALKDRRPGGKVIDNHYALVKQRVALASAGADDDAAPELIPVEKVAEECQVHRATVYDWATRGLYGATTIDRALFFDRKQLAARTREPSGKSERVQCSGAGCAELVTRSASQLRRNGGRAYCDSCWPAARREVVLDLGPQAIRDMDPEDRLNIWRDAQRKVEPERAEARKEAAAAGTRGYMDDLRRRSHTQYVEHFARMQRGRGTTLRPETEAALEAWSRSYARKGRAGRKPAADLPSRYAEWALMLDDVRDYYERQACTGEPMPSDWALFLAVAMEDQQNHPERWTYDPMDLPRNAADRVAKAIKKYLQIAQNEIALNGST